MKRMTTPRVIPEPRVNAGAVRWSDAALELFNGQCIDSSEHGQ
jgi:hypothetical protein